jgi:signal transduction histidine kinase
MDRLPEQAVVAYDSGPGTLTAPESARTAPPSAAGVVASWATRSRLWGIVVLALVYYGAARFGYAFGFSGPIAAIVWLPVGVGAAFLSIGGLSFWPGALIGDLLANDYSSLPLSGAVGQTIGNLLEVIVIAAITRRLMRKGSPLESLGGVAGLLGAIGVGVAVSAIIGPLSLAASGGLPIHKVVHTSWTWWLGDTSGALLVLPLALAWARRKPLPLTLPRSLEAIAVLAGIAALSWIAAKGLGPAYAIVPVLALAAIRFGPRAATSTVFVSVALVVWGETDQHGHFQVGAFTDSVLKTQIFIIVAAVSSLCWTALVAEREHAVQELKASEIRAFAAAESERRRMERNLHDGAQQRLLALAVKLGLRAREESPTERLFLEDVESELRTAIDELRDLSHGIHPSVLSELGLAGAIRTLAGRSAIPVTLLELPAYRADAESQAAVYYALTEALANAQKHSGASSIRVRVSSDRGWLRLVVTDDGVGGASEPAGTGISGIRQRMDALGGTFDLESPRGIGTQITAAVPITGVQ